MASWEGPLDDLRKYQARGRVVNFTLPAHPPSGRPGVRGAAVEFDVSEAGGTGRLRVERGAVDLPGVLEEPQVPVDQLAADLQWQLDGPRISLSATGLRVANRDLDATGQVTWRTGDAARGRFPGVLDLQVSLARADGARVWRYLPLGVPKDTRDYVRDAVTAGQASDGRFRVKGDLNDFPFKDPKAGEFRVSARVRDATYAYVPRANPRATVQWAALTGLAFVAAWMIVRGMLAQQRAARSLRAGERRHLDLLGMAADWYWETNRHHELTGLRRSARYPVVYPNAPDGTLAWKVPGVDPEAPWRHSLQTLMEQREAFDDLRVERQDSQGHRRISMVCARPVFDEQGRFHGYRGVGHDITAQVEAQLALEASEVRLASIIESAMDAIVICGADQRILVFNAAAARMFGRPAQETLGAPLDILLPASFRAAHGEQMRKFGQKHSTPRTMRRGSHVWALRANGEEFPVDASISHVEVAGEPLYAVVMRDITSRLAAERALRASEQEQRRLVEQLRQAQKIESLGAIAGGIAHDFNNVIAAILGNARLAQDHLGNAPDASRYLAEISSAGYRARELVKRIMTFSRKQPAVFVRQPLGPVVREAVDLLRATLPSGVRISLQGDDQAFEVMADATQLHQVVMNLGTNAWQAMGQRTGRIDVALRPVLGSPWMRLSVQDNGSGMDAATQARIFEPFFTTKPDGEGTGLGLSVVQGIVQAHQGEISVSSAPGQGCRFDILLPLAPSGEADGAAGPEAAAASASPAPASGGAGRQVVYVDDYEAMVAMVGAVLEGQGYQVRGFDRSTDALDYLRGHAQEVDLLITDYNMPEMSGLDLTHAARALRPDLPVIVASGHLSADLRAGAAAAGVDCLFDKPAGIDELCLRIAQVLQARTGG